MAAHLWLLLILFPLFERGHVAYASTSRLFAIGDLHGDLNNALRCFQLCNLTNANGDWIGGNSVLVQTGDVVDRGPHSRQVVPSCALMEAPSIRVHSCFALKKGIIANCLEFQLYVR